MLACLWLAPAVAVAAAPKVNPAIAVLPALPATGTAADPALGMALQELADQVLLATPAVAKFSLVAGGLRRVFRTAVEFDAWLQGRPLSLQVVGQRLKNKSLIMHYSGTPAERKVELALVNPDGHMAALVMAPVDLPGLVQFRQGLLLLLKSAGLAPPPDQEPAVLWRENLPLPALRALGRGLWAMRRAGAFDRGSVTDAAALFREATAAAADSYLANDYVGWAALSQEATASADEPLRRALALNPRGVDALDGLAEAALKRGDDADGEQFAKQSALAAGRPVDRALAMHLHSRARYAHHRGDHQREMADGERACALLRTPEPDYMLPWCQLQLASLAASHQQHLQAAAYAESARQVALAWYAHSVVALAAERAAEAYDEAQQPARALPLWREAAGKAPWASERAHAFERASRDAEKLHDLAAAIDLQRQAVAQLESLEVGEEPESDLPSARARLQQLLAQAGQAN
ncbi:MAG: hypothetical protein HY902_09125 [Deltaproteobacteria bacterium]|nr:hypothetical protein [Deltaproteobacteria bacterium]